MSPRLMMVLAGVAFLASCVGEKEAARKAEEAAAARRLAQTAVATDACAAFAATLRMPLDAAKALTCELLPNEMAVAARDPGTRLCAVMVKSDDGKWSPAFIGTQWTEEAGARVAQALPQTLAGGIELGEALAWFESHCSVSTRRQDGKILDFKGGTSLKSEAAPSR